MKIKSRIDKNCTYGITNINQLFFVIREWLTNKDYYELPEIGATKINVNYHKQPSRIYKANNGSTPIIIIRN